MTPEQRQAAEAWQRTHQPGDPTMRAAARRRRKNNADARALLAERPDCADSPEAEELAAAIAALRAERDRLATVQAAQEDHDFSAYAEGVFA